MLVWLRAAKAAPRLENLAWEDDLTRHRRGRVADAHVQAACGQRRRRMSQACSLHSLAEVPAAGRDVGIATSSCFAFSDNSLVGISIDPGCNSLSGVMRRLSCCSLYLCRMPQWGRFVSKGGASTTVARGHRCPNVRIEVTSPSASREDRTVRRTDGVKRIRRVPPASSGDAARRSLS